MVYGAPQQNSETPPSGPLTKSQPAPGAFPSKQKTPSLPAGQTMFVLVPQAHTPGADTIPQGP
jgi:hypothetical protein